MSLSHTAGWFTAAAIALLATTETSARPASTGLFTEAGIGATTFVGRHADHSKMGVAFDMRAGYDLFSWFSVGINVAASSHEATVPPPPEGEYFQLYRALGEARLGFRYGRVGLFVDGGAGGAMISTNILGKVNVTTPGETLAFIFAAGGGLEYQLANRHYALGIAGQWLLLPRFNRLAGVTTRIYLRYTY